MKSPKMLWFLQKLKKQVSFFFFERFDRNPIASSLFQKNKKTGKSVFALLVCCLLMTFSSKNHENHNFFLAVASQKQIECFSFFYDIEMLRVFRGKSLKNIFKNIEILWNSSKTWKSPYYWVQKKDKNHRKSSKHSELF